MRNSPCNGCNERHRNCHTYCMDYIEYQEEIDSLKRNKRKDYNAESYVIDKGYKIKRREGKRK